MIKNITILKTFKSTQDTCPKPSQGCNTKDYFVPGKKDDHLKSIWNDDPKACFKNAIEKKAFTEKQVLDRDDYIMYMCSDDNFDHFKSKTTKTKWKVKRATKYAQSTGLNGHSYVNV
jgi:hypothetical protein